MEDLILGNRYKLVKKIGVGGMALVYKAEDILLNRYVAVKVLKDEYSDDRDFLQKFQNEARSAAKLTHPNIVSVYDVGTEQVDDKTLNYIVMELIDGKTIKDMIHEDGIFNEKKIIDYSVQIANAIRCAHENKIIHRDIKPQNILIDQNGIVKVTDFGIARIINEATITYTSTVLGTVHYISPEQAKGKYIDERSDIYSLGVVMYEMATGKIPFDASNAVGIALKHIQEPLVEPVELNADISPFLNQIIVKALEKIPSDRYQNIDMLIQALTKDVTNEQEHIIVKPSIPDTMDSTMVIDSDEINDALESDPPPVKKFSKTQKTKIKNYSDKQQKESFLLPILLGIVFAVILVFGITYFTNGKIKNVIVPNFIGYTQAQAQDIAEHNNLTITFVETENHSYENGTIINQNLKEGKAIRSNETITLTLNKIKSIKMPDLRGLDITNATNVLRQSGLNVGSVTNEYSNEYGKGLIISQSIDPGQYVQSGDAINIVVSNGSQIRYQPAPEPEEDQPTVESIIPTPPNESNDAPTDNGDLPVTLPGQDQDNHE